MRRQRLRNVLMATLAAAAAIALCELSLRAFNLGPQIYAVADGMFRLSSDPQVGYELLPGAQDGADSISSKGLRDREYSVTKPAGVFRIAVIGDSVAFGFEIPQREAMPKALERLLHRPGPSAPPHEVLNFGVEGYSSAQIARRMVTTVSRYNPDLVVYLYCLNDPDSGWDYIQQILVDQLDRPEKSMVVSQLGHPRSLLSQFRVYWLARTALSSFGPEPEVKLALYEEEASYFAALHARRGMKWNATVRNIQQIAAETHKIGAVFVGVISPIFHANGQVYRDNYPLSEVHGQVADAFRSVGAHVLDLAPTFAKFPTTNKEPAGFDILHYSVDGHQFVAAALLEFLLNERLLPDLGSGPS